MRKILFTLFALMSCVIASAQFSSAPAFPGAEGYGRYATGGRGGTVYHVTSLDDDAANPAEGTLRYYITKKSGPRIIVFDVAGTIELQAQLKIAKGDLTILGQTAPGNGICLKNYPLCINADNVIVRFIRCRLGDLADNDAMSASHHDDAVCRNIIIDHCSLSWCTDEVGSFYGNENFTLQWCILSESLKDNAAKGTSHGYGGIWGGKKASFHHNLLAHNDSRMPRFDHGYVSTLAGPVDYVNNVVYNWGGNSTYGGENEEGCESKKINMINNYYKPGAATKSSATTRFLNPTTACGNCDGTDVPATFYISGNYMYGSAEATATNVSSSTIKMDSSSPISYDNWKSKYVVTAPFKTTDAEFQYNTINMQTPEKAFEKVVATAGASFSRDAVDTRVAQETKDGTWSCRGSNGSTNGLIDAASDAGGWPVLTGTPKQDTDKDGMPDEWEIANGLNPEVNDAGRYNLDSRRYYTNIEVYAHSLVEDIVKAEQQGAVQGFEEYYPDMQNGETEDRQIYYVTKGEAPSETADGHSCYNFADYASVIMSGRLASEKKYAAGTSITYNGKKDAYYAIKVSNGAENKFVAPAGKYVSSVKIVSYINNATGTRTTYWREVGGHKFATEETDAEGKVTYTPTADAQIHASRSGSEPDVCTFNIGGKSEFTFTNIGEQVAFILDVTYGQAAGITSVNADRPASAGATYNIMGQRVQDNARGIVIRGGKKYVVR